MKWQKKLTKGELKHLKEDAGITTLRAFRRMRKDQLKREKIRESSSFRGDNVDCWECKHIAKKLKME